MAKFRYRTAHVGWCCWGKCQLMFWFETLSLRAGTVCDFRAAGDRQDLHGYRSHLAALEAEAALPNPGEEE